MVARMPGGQVVSRRLHKVEVCHWMMVALSHYYITAKVLVQVYHHPLLLYKKRRSMHENNRVYVSSSAYSLAGNFLLLLLLQQLRALRPSSVRPSVKSLRITHMILFVLHATTTTAAAATAKGLSSKA